MPLDLSAEEVSADLLKTPIDLNPEFDSAVQEKAVAAIKDALACSKHPSIIVDSLVQCFNAVAEARDLVSKLNVPWFSANGGKGLVDETHEMYVGVDNGVISHPGVNAAARASDLMITLGYLPADTNSGGFSRKLDVKKTIYINPFEVVVSYRKSAFSDGLGIITTLQVKGETFSNTAIKPLLAALVTALPSTPLHNISRPQLPPPRQPKDADAKHITQSWLYPQFEKFFRPGDVVVVEVGTSCFGVCDIKFPANTRFLCQVYYGSIGWATAATLGADIARREISGDKGRTILITGDGSLAMTMQEIGTMIKAGIKPILFVNNNDGYTVERMIWGARECKFPSLYRQ
jgi:pyruvate decarboxylase